MRIHLYTVSLNEMSVLGFFFRHYEPWVTRFVVFDDCSTDGTVDFLRAKPNVEVRTREYSYPDSLVLSGKTIRDQCWRESRGIADWVIIVDIDEHLYHPDMERYLADCKRDGTTLMPALGYEMLTDDFPAAGEHLASTHTLGAPEINDSKLRIFNPDAIAETNFTVGGHAASPSGRIVLPARDEMLLLHYYKHLGIEYALARNSFLQTRQRALDLQNNWGYQYAWKREDYERVRHELAKSLVDLRDPSHVPWRDHRVPRWWRDAPPPHP